jgi:hypothetical protein
MTATRSGIECRTEGESLVVEVADEGRSSDLGPTTVEPGSIT